MTVQRTRLSLPNRSRASWSCICGEARHTNSLARMRTTTPSRIRQSDWPSNSAGLAAVQPRQLNNLERSIRELWNDHGPGWREARVELHRRFAFPLRACLCVGCRSSGGAAAPRWPGSGGATRSNSHFFLLLLSVMGAGLARQGTLTPAAGIWIAMPFFSRWDWRSCPDGTVSAVKTGCSAQ